MATETDQYKIDVSEAIASLKRIEEQTKEIASSTQKTGDTQTASFIKAGAALGVLKQGYDLLIGVMKDALHNALETEKVDRLLEKSAGKYADMLKMQASTMQSTLGVSDDMVKKMQNLALIAGVGAGDIERLTMATLDYAAVTNQDGVSAMSSLLRALEQGKDGARSLGLQYESTGKFAGDLTKAVGELERKFGGSAAAAADTMQGSIDRLNAEFEDLTKGLAFLALDIFKQTGLMQALTEATIGWRIAIFGDEQQKQNEAIQAEFQKLNTEKVALAEKYRLADLRAKELESLAEDGHQGAVRAYKEAQREMLTYGNQLDEIEGKLAKFKKDRDERVGGGPKTDPNRKTGKDDKEEKKIKFEDTPLGHAFANIDAQNKLEADALERVRKFNEALADIQGKAAQDALSEKEKQDQKFIEAELAKKQKLKDLEQKFNEEMLSELKNYGQQAAQFALDLAGEQILASTMYQEQFREATIEKRLLEEQAQDASKTRADIEREMAQEEAAAYNKKLAEFLISPAKQAAMRAIMDGAEGASYLGTPGMQGFAAQKFISAGLFAAVAAAAGGGALVASQSRGMTKDEKDSIDALKKRDEDRKEREAKQTGQQGGSGGPNVVVNFLGITGFTEAQQAAEIARVQAQYNKLKTGN